MKKVLVLVLVIFAFGCSKKYVQPDGHEGDEADSNIVAVKEEISHEEGDMDSSVVDESLFEFKDALFDYDKYTIRPDARDALDSVATWLNSHKGINVMIEGHCDERGTNEYNLALGEKRAKAARDYLIAQGISSRRMATITYGEEKPLCPHDNEACWQMNRRAHFVVTK